MPTKAIYALVLAMVALVYVFGAGDAEPVEVKVEP